VKTYIEEILTIFSGFDQTVFSFLIAHTHNSFSHSSQPTVAFFTATVQPNRPLEFIQAYLKGVFVLYHNLPRLYNLGKL
jgi:hypothetical protein